LINGQRLSGVQIMKDGDEIMIGKTVMRFAGRHSDAPQPVGADRRTPFLQKRFYLATAAICCLAAAVAFVFLAFPNDLQRLASRAPASIDESLQFSPPVSKQHAAAPQSPVAAAGADEMNRSARPASSFYIRNALADYAAGRLGSARESLRMLTAATERTTERFLAEHFLAMLDAEQDLHTRAMAARKQKRFAEAIECWDRLLAIDVELIGDHPSFFAAQAEQQVQTLSYEYALNAFRTKNTEKARQLCDVILQIDPKNEPALALLAKIDSKA
jgi:tetratricopeptide (TPR) repeat protein